ncbi:MAG TPA: PKD domain-containing protein, partial [Candidatus Eisenbacteria bacterium]
MRNRAFPGFVLLGLVTVAFLPGFADASGQGQDLAGMLASGAAERATAVSGPVIDISPPSHNFGRVNVGSSGGTFDFTVTNTGDADLHISGATESNPGTGFSLSSAVVPGTIAPGGTGLITVAWTAVGSGYVADNFLINCDATNGSFPILAYGMANNAPEFTPALLATYVADAFVPFSLTASAADPEGDLLDWSLTSLPVLPVGASFDHANGTLALTPAPGDAGNYSVTINVADGLATTPGSFTLQIRALNSPPVANPGGPYKGYTGLPLQLDGTASSDPDAGQTLSYEWGFGDGTQGTGPSPAHTYVNPFVYTVTLTVTDSDVLHLQNTATTTADIKNFIEGTIVQSLTSTNVIRTTGKGVQKFGIQMVLRPATDVDPSTIRMSTTYPNAGTVSEIEIADKRLRLGDLNGDLFRDL